MRQPPWKTVWSFLRELKTELLYDPLGPHLGVYPDRSLVQKDTCTPLFTAALFTVAKTWRQAKCPPREDWIKKTRHTYAMQYCSASEKKRMPSAATRMQLDTVTLSTQMQLDTVILCEESQEEKDNCHVTFHICGI